MQMDKCVGMRQGERALWRLSAPRPEGEYFVMQENQEAGSSNRQDQEHKTNMQPSVDSEGPLL